MINIVEDWGISTENYTRQDNCNNEILAKQNSCIFNKNIDNGQEVYLPADPNGQSYEFNKIKIIEKDNVTFYGEPDNNGNLPVIKFSNDIEHTHLKIKDADSFNIYDLIFDGSDALNEGGVWARDGATNGILKNLTVYDAHGVSIVVGDGSKSNPAHHVDVEDCTVYGQRKWGGNEKAMILAGGYGHDITFKNCKTYSINPNNSGFYSPADHFDTDNATNVEYHNCTADGTGYDAQEDGRKGKGFWNEAGGEDKNDHETSATYYGCTAIQTDGGLAAMEKSTVEAYDFYFDNCSGAGWAARSQGENANIKIYNSTFDGCFSFYPHYRGGCVVIGSAATIDNCEFINTPDSINHDEYNMTLYTAESHAKPVTIENNMFDRSIKGFNDSHGTGDVNVRYNEFELGAEVIQQGDYDWQVSGNDYTETATTTAVNSPTSSTKVAVV